MNDNFYKFARFDLVGSGHVYLRCGDITAITDPSAGEPYDAQKRQETEITCGYHRYRVAHNYAAVLSTVDKVLSGNTSDMQQTGIADAVPPLPK